MSTAGSQEGIPQPVVQHAARRAKGQQQQRQEKEGDQYAKQRQGAGCARDAGLHLAVTAWGGAISHPLMAREGGRRGLVIHDRHRLAATHHQVVGLGGHLSGRGIERWLRSMPADAEGQIADKQQRQQQPGQSNAGQSCSKLGE